MSDNANVTMPYRNGDLPDAGQFKAIYDLFRNDLDFQLDLRHRGSVVVAVGDGLPVMLVRLRPDMKTLFIDRDGLRKQWLDGMTGKEWDRTMGAPHPRNHKKHKKFRRHHNAAAHI
jgi:hypothetical protein